MLDKHTWLIRLDLIQVIAHAVRPINNMRRIKTLRKGEDDGTFCCFKVEKGEHQKRDNLKLYTT